MATYRILVPLFLVTVLQAQSLLWTQTGTQGIGIGSFSALLGDRDGDGFDDFITFAAVRDPVSGQGQTEMLPVSGRTGSFLPGGAKQVSPDYYLLGVRRAGDMDGDGVADYAAMVVANSRNYVLSVEVRSGRDDEILWSVDNRDFGQEIRGDLDLNGDGHPDLLVGSGGFTIWIGYPPALVVGCIWAFDHKGRLLYQRIGTDPTYLIGGPMARLGDVDQDGCDDFLMSVFQNPSTGHLDPGYVDIVSGRTGQSIRRVQGAQPGDRIGAESVADPLSACGDLDGDGLPDFVAGGGSVAGRGTVQVFSSRTGQVLHAWYSGSYRDFFGAHVVGDLDVDRDGLTDIIATEPNALGLRGLVHVYSGRDWSEIFRYTDPTGLVGGSFQHILRMPSQPGEVFPRFMVAGPAWHTQPGPFLGRHYMFSGAPQGVVPSGAGCIGTLGTEPRMGLRDLGTQGARVTLSGGEPLGGAILAVGASLAVPGPVINLQALGFTGCSLHPMPQEVRFFPLDATGYAFHDFLRPLVPAGSGLTAYGQWIALGSGATFPGAASDALRWSMR